MCDKTLLFIANLYPFNKKINRSLFLKLNYVFTIVIFAIYFSSINTTFKIGLFYFMMILLSPLGIHQWISKENPLYGVGNAFVCLVEFGLLSLGLLYFISN